MKIILNMISLLMMSFSLMVSAQVNNLTKAQVKKDLDKSRLLNEKSLVVNNNQAGSFVSIGFGVDCDFDEGTPIQDVIDSGATEIRITNSTYIENIVIDDISLTLRGGFSNCTDAVNNIQTTARTEIDASDSGGLPVIQILGDTQRNFVRLENLHINDGYAGLGLIYGGGISVISADVEIQLVRVTIANNDGIIGAGLAIQNGEVDLIASDVIIEYNNAESNAGGLYCQGISSMLFYGTSIIVNNTANGTSATTGKGGGVLIKNGCTLSMYPDLSGSLGNHGMPGILSNQATAEGGGLYVEFGAQLFLFGQQMCIESECLGGNDIPFHIYNNQSDSDFNGNENGGGIYLTGLSSNAMINGVYLNDNKAGGNGGGIYLDDDTSLSINRISKACWSNDRCNLVLNNSTGANLGFGGAIYNKNAELNISTVYFEENRADIGTVIYATGDNSTSRFESSVFDDNGDDTANGYSDIFVFSASLGAGIEVLHSTIVDNNAEQAVFGIDVGFGTSLSLQSSIVHDPSSGDVLPAAHGDVDAHCVIVHESASFTGTQISVNDPDFIDRLGGDFHLNSPSSPAIDYCDENLDIQHKDIDFENRGWDDPEVNNVLGPFDIGADETYENDVIFISGFE